jgi:hypothetical protein
MTEIKREVITKKYRKVINTCKGFGVFWLVFKYPRRITLFMLPSGALPSATWQQSGASTLGIVFSSILSHYLLTHRLGRQWGANPTLKSLSGLLRLCAYRALRVESAESSVTPYILTTPKEKLLWVVTLKTGSGD